MRCSMPRTWNLPGPQRPYAGTPMLAAEGYCLYPAVFTAAEMAALARALPTVEGAGTRSLLDDERVLRVARDPRLRELVGPDFFAVRALLFDKTSECNWSVRWHQDLAV